jgi:hypothetical protein
MAKAFGIAPERVDLRGCGDAAERDERFGSDVEAEAAELAPKSAAG